MSLAYDRDAASLVEGALLAEAAGIDMLWIPEAYGFDGVSLMGFLTAKTSTIGIAAGILPLGTRTPTLLAMTAAGLDSLSGGRFTMGLGTSGPQVIQGLHGVTFDQPIIRTRETIEVCRLVWQREPVIYKGKTIELPLPGNKPLKLITTPLRPQIPITVAAIGPKNVELTAEIADGWLPMYSFFHPGRWRDVWGEAYDAGTAKRDPSLGPLDIVVGGDLAIGPDAAKHRDATRALVALYVGGMGSREKNFYNDLFARYGYVEEAKAIQDLFLDRKRDEAAALVPDEFLDAMSLCGDEDFVRAQVKRYHDAGVTNLVVRPIGDDRAGTLRKLRAIVDEVAPG